MKAVFWGIESANRLLNKGPKIENRQSYYVCLTYQEGDEHQKNLDKST